jgi:hypothetical protein
MSSQHISIYRMLADAMNVNANENLLAGTQTPPCPQAQPHNTDKHNNLQPQQTPTLTTQTRDPKYQHPTTLKRLD